MEPQFYAEYNRHERSHWWFRWRRQLIRSLVKQELTGKQTRVLDAGCGTGSMVEHLADLCEPVGIDVAPQAVDFAAAHGVRSIVRGSLDTMPFDPATFDTVLILDVLEHIEDDSAVLRNLYTVLRPGGHLIVTVPAFRFLWSEHDEVNHHKRRYTAAEVHQIIEDAGFQVRRVTYCNAVLFGPILIRRAALKLLRQLERRQQAPARTPRSDLCAYPRPINKALYLALAAEMKLLGFVDLPFGSSILALADRPSRADSADAAMAPLAGQADARFKHLKAVVASLVRTISDSPS
jgi:SAM-dependent methyltransferase